MSSTILRGPVHSNDDLFRLWQELLDEVGLGERSLWLTFLEPDGRPVGLVIPIDDVPETPDPELLTTVAYVVDQICARHGMASAPMLLTRPGSAAVTDSDRSWARGLTSAMGDRQRWPLHLATKDHLQAFTPDDLA